MVEHSDEIYPHLNSADWIWNSDLLPDTDGAYDIGSSSKGIKELHFSPMTCLQESGGMLDIAETNASNSFGKKINCSQIWIGSRVDEGIVALHSHGGITDSVIIGDPTQVPEIVNVTTTERDALDPFSGMLVYNETLSLMQIYDSAWITLAVLENAQTFTAKQTFSGHIHLGIGKFLELDDDGNTKITSPANNRMSFVVNDGTKLEIYSSYTNVNNDQRLTQGKKMIFDTDVDTYMLCSADDVLEIYVQGSKNLTLTSGATTFSRELRVYDKLMLSWVTFTDGDTTPTIASNTGYQENNTNPTTITDFDDPGDGQIIHIVFLTANTTITHGTHIHCISGANTNPPANATMSFIYDNTTGDWYQISGYQS